MANVRRGHFIIGYLFEDLQASRRPITRCGIARVQPGRLREPNLGQLGTANPPQPELKPRLCCYLQVLTFVGRFQSFKSRRHSGIELTERKYCTPVLSGFARDEAILISKTKGILNLAGPWRVTTITRKETASVKAPPLLLPLKSEIGWRMPWRAGAGGLTS